VILIQSLPAVFDEPAAYVALVIALAAALVGQRFLGWRRYAALHRLRLAVFPILDGYEGLFLVSTKRARDDPEYLGTVDDASVRDVWSTLTDAGASPHLLSTVKARPWSMGTTQFARAHAVWTHSDGSQTEAYLFAATPSSVDVYAHHEPTVLTPEKHLSGAQTDGDPRGVVTAALGDDLTDESGGTAPATQLRAIAGDDADLPDPARVELDADAVEAATTALLPADADADIVTADGTYYAADGDDGLWQLRDIADAAADLPYTAEEFDCEDFGRAFRTLAAHFAGINAVGVAYDWSTAHAYNVIVTADGTARVYEPQDDIFKELGEGNYKLEHCLIVF